MSYYRFRWLSNWYLLFPGIVVSSGVLVPFAYLTVRAFEAETTELIEIVFRSRNLHLFANSLLLVGSVIIADVILAAPLAWLTCRTDVKARRIFTLMGVLPLAIPGYVMAFAFIGLGGADGPLTQLFGRNIPRLSGYWGSLLVLSFYTAPYLFLNLRSALLGIDPALEESASALGYSPLEVIRYVILPQLRPAFYAGALIAGLHVLGDFGVVSLMRFETFSYALYLQYTSAFDRIYAAWFALMLVALAVALLYTEGRLLKGLNLHRVGSGTLYSPQSAPLNGWAKCSYLYLVVLTGASVVLPTGTVLFWMVKSFDVACLQNLIQALSGSFFASAPAAILCTSLALPLAYVGVHRPSPVSRLLERVAYMGYATPPLAFALSLIFVVLWALPGIYQTLWVLIYAYILHFLAEAIGPTRSAIYQASPSIAEAARSLGCTRPGAFFKATFPLLVRGLSISTAFVFLSAMKELPIAFLLSPIGFDTLALSVWSNTSEAMFAEAAPYALLILIFSGLFVGLLLFLGRRTYDAPT